MNRLTMVIFCVALCVCAGCGPGKDVVARIGSEVLTAAELQEEVAGAPADYSDFLKTESGQRHFIDVLIKEKLMIAAAKKEKLHHESAIKRMIEAYERDMNAQFEEYKSTLLIQEYYQRLKERDLVVTDGEVDTYYEQHQEQYAHPVEITFRHMLLADPREAAQVIARARAGEDFAALTTTSSIDIWTAGENGLLVYNQPGSFLPEIETAILALKTGAVSDAIETELGYHVLKKVSQKKAAALSREQAGETIRPLLERQKFDRVMKRLQDDIPVTLYEDAIARELGEQAAP